MSDICWGKINYETYRETVGGVSINGDKMKEFNELSDRVKLAWAIGAISVINEFKLI